MNPSIRITARQSVATDGQFSISDCELVGKFLSNNRSQHNTWKDVLDEANVLFNLTRNYVGVSMIGLSLLHNVPMYIRST